jgi:hypothetical protein
MKMWFEATDPKFLTQTGGCGSEDELTPRPAGHKFAQCNNPTSLFALDHAVASPLPAAMLCPKNSRLLRRDDRTGQKFAYVYFEDELGGCAHHSLEKNKFR